MPAHTPAGASILKFIQHENGSHGDWMVRVEEHQGSPSILVTAWRDDEVETAPEKTLEVQAGPIHLEDDELDEATKTIVRDWIASLS